MSVTPLWQIDIQKRLGNEYWTNVYHAQAADMATITSIADAIVNLERALHNVQVIFTSYRVSPFPGPSEGTVRPVGLTGGDASTDYLPLFNVLRVDFPVDTGRPSRKFYRLPIPESYQANGVLTPATVTLFQGFFDNWFETELPGGLRDVDNQVITSGVVMPAVGMRQLRRGTRRRTTPVIPVS